MQNSADDRTRQTRPTRKYLRLLRTPGNHHSQAPQDCGGATSKHSKRTTLEIQRWASAIQQSLGIRDNAHIVLILGTGTKKSVADALADWVQNNLSDVRSDSPDEVLDELCRRLRRELLDLTDRQRQPWDVPGE